MLEWLKRRLRKWLEADVTSGDGTLEAILPGVGRKRFSVTGCVGLRLAGLSEADGEVRLIGPEEAADPDRFWEEWRRWNPRGSGLVWESDGTPFVPQKGYDGHLGNGTENGEPD